MGRAPTQAPSIRRTDEPKYDPVFRAQVQKAKSILCYYDEATFHVAPFVDETGAPPLERMWFAQVALWIQQDVVNALAELNRKAADQVTKTDPCVQHVPVKRLVALRVLGYELPGTRLVFPQAASRATDPLPAGVGGPSFTGRKCDDEYDVVRFVVSVVVDQRDVLKVIDSISRVNFYQCVGAHYEAVDDQVAQAQGYFYGTDPVVKAALEFEGYLAREVYGELMPPAVQKLLSGPSEGD
jgi:hypothetical protein